MDKNTLVLGIPIKFIDELKGMLTGWANTGYAPIKELRVVAGKCWRPKAPALADFGLNFAVGAELAICLEELGVEEIRAIHVPGKANVEADFLSRPSTWKTTTMPKAPGLEGVDIGSIHVPGPMWKQTSCTRLPTPREGVRASGCLPQEKAARRLVLRQSGMQSADKQRWVRKRERIGQGSSGSLSLPPPRFVCVLNRFSIYDLMSFLVFVLYCRGFLNGLKRMFIAARRLKMAAGDSEESLNWDVFLWLVAVGFAVHLAGLLWLCRACWISSCGRRQRRRSHRKPPA